jgi:hypothetical protein
LLGDVKAPLEEQGTKSQHIFWQQEKTMNDLAEEVEKRLLYEKLNFSLLNIYTISILFKYLDDVLKEREQFRYTQNQSFFKNHIASIKFYPDFHAFGLDQYFLYIHPSDMDQIDFKHLLNNAFQSIKYPTIIDTTNSFFINYLFPFNTPNMKHLNWYTESKKVIREYCLFSIKAFHQILNFDKNIDANGWDYDSNRFQIHAQNILFDSASRNRQPQNIRTSKLGSVPDKNISNPDSQEFKAFTELYSIQSSDIKSFLGRNYHTKINAFTTLFNKNLIFPYLKLKNFDFQDTFYIILPAVDPKWNQKLLQIFNFFNYGFVYEIEGDFYIHGFDKVEHFENGFMIKLYFPQCELHEFIRIFDQIFEYMDTDRYIMLSDLANGKTFLKNLYGDLEFLKSYNPLKNLIWNDKDKIWMNHKLYNEKFEKLYPDMIPKEKK